MIQLKNISLSFGEQTLFDDISLNINSGQRIGLVGRNGAGKSTLLKVISGLLQPDSGSISLEKDKIIAYMPQEVVVNSTLNVFDEAFTTFERFLLYEQEIINLEKALEGNSEDAENLLERYVYLQEQLKEFDKSAAIARTEKILDGLGFNASQKQQSVQTLSEGWKMRLVLTKLLLMQADFYLFDEPTNHLDMITKEWFFDFIKNGKFGFLLVSHDRYFLEKACDWIFELERGKGTLYNGGFSKYLIEKEAQRELLISTRDRQEKEIARKTATAERFRASATKAKMAQSLFRQIEKIEVVEVEPPMPTIKLSFPEIVRAGNTVLVVKDLKQSFDNRVIFENVNCEIQRGEKVSIIAPNGTGKTTFFNAIIGKYKLEKGSVTFGYNVQYAIFEQDQLKALTPNNTIIQEVLEAVPNVTESTIRSFLGQFLFSGDDIYKKIRVLSGGERNRVAMVKVLLQKANFLLLDEPTNHLDLYAKEILLQALLQYNGTILLVSHDHDFLNKLSTRILELTPTGMHSYPGNYEAYLYHKKQQTVKKDDNSKKVEISLEVKQKEKIADQSTSYVLKKELSSLENKISRAETDIKRIQLSFAQLEYGTEKYKETLKKLEAAQDSLSQMLSKWENIQNKL